MQDMKDPQKGFITALLLTVIVVLFLVVGGEAYVYVKMKSDRPPAVDSSAPAVVRTAPAVEAVPVQATPVQTVSASQDSSGRILLGDKAKYANLSSDEKAVVVNYLNNFLKNIPQMYWSDFSVSGCILKYYDSDKILVGCAQPKPSFPLYLVNRNDWKDIGQYSGQLNLFDGYVESKEYAIAVNDAGIFYYKTGDPDISLVPGSKLTDAGETYVESIGMAYSYGVTFDEPTKTLTVSVYKALNKLPNPRIRTVKFVLP